jgi:hypothetical protein
MSITESQCSRLRYALYLSIVSQPHPPMRQPVNVTVPMSGVPRPTAPILCNMDIVEPAGIPPPLVIAATDIQVAATLPVATPELLKPMALRQKGAPTTAVIYPASAPVVNMDVGLARNLETVPGGVATGMGVHMVGSLYRFIKYHIMPFSCRVSTNPSTTNPSTL